jgi:flagellar biosynthesis protein FlhB
MLHFITVKEVVSAACPLFKKLAVVSLVVSVLHYNPLASSTVLQVFFVPLSFIHNVEQWFWCRCYREL